MQSVKCKGAEIPAIGLGTWPMRGAGCNKIVEEALALGYRHIDTAQMYGNEADVGEAARMSGLPREEIFITTKVEREWASSKDLPRSVEDSLRRLRLDFVDLLLIHWPNPSVPVAETVNALLEMKRLGRTRHIGVSNYSKDLVEQAVRAAPTEIVVNQIEYHPFIDQTSTIEANRRHGIATTAYSPIARGRIAGNAVIEDIAAAHGKSAFQVTLRWLLQKDDVIAIPKTSNAARLRENIDVFNFTLSNEDISRMNGLTRRR